MARMKHFPTLTEYAKWVLKQAKNNHEAILGTAFTGIQTPYELFLSDYYNTPVTVIAGDCYELKGSSYELPSEWECFTVDYHECDLREAYEATEDTQSGIEVTIAQEVTYLRGLLGSEIVPVQKYEQAPKELIEAASIAKGYDKFGNLLGYSVKSNTSNRYYHIIPTIIAGETIYQCNCEAHRYGHDECRYIKAIKLVEAARKEMAKEQAAAVAEAERIVAEQKRQRFEALREEVKAIEAGVSVEQYRSLERWRDVLEYQQKRKENSPLNGRGFRVESIPELNGASVPLK